MILRTVVVLIAVLFSSAAQAGYVTYQTWSAGSEAFRGAYIAGAFDSFVIPWEGEASEKTVKHYSTCIREAEMTNSQLAANVLAFAKDKPELHTGSVQAALLGYLNAACGKSPAE
jgi:hypothetical protein